MSEPYVDPQAKGCGFMGCGRPQCFDTCTPTPEGVQFEEGGISKMMGLLLGVAYLHRPQRFYPEFRFAPFCGECSQGFTAGGDDPPSARQVSWPCKTARTMRLVDPLAPKESGSDEDDHTLHRRR